MAAPTNSKLVVKLLSNKSQLQLEDQLVDDPSRPEEQGQLLENYVRACMGGLESAEWQLLEGADSATGTFTVASSGAQSLTIAGVTLTGGSSYDIAGLSAAEVALNIVDAINDSQSPALQLVGAEVGPSSDIVKVQALNDGLVGNYIPISASGAITASGSELSGGSSGELKVYQFGLR